MPGNMSSATAASAQVPKLETLIPGTDGTAAGRIVQLILVITVLSVAPGLLVMVTCFTRFVVALSFLRAGLGLQTTPANLILISLALFMTFYVMGPTFDQAWQNGVQPLMENKINEQEAFTRISTPFKAFMRANVRDKDLKLFEELAPASRQKGLSQADPAAIPAGRPGPGFDVSADEYAFTCTFSAPVGPDANGSGDVQRWQHDTVPRGDTNERQRDLLERLVERGHALDHGGVLGGHEQRDLDVESAVPDRD